MADATGETREPLRVAFDRRLKLEFHGAQDHLRRRPARVPRAGRRPRPDRDGRVHPSPKGRRGRNIRHRLLGLLRQAIYGRLAGYEDVNDAERLARDPAMRAIVGREGLDRPAASSSEMGRFETEWLATEANLAALAACPAPGSTGCTRAGRRTASSSTWTVGEPDARRTGRLGLERALSAAPATTRCSCSTSSATSSAAAPARQRAIAPTIGAPSGAGDRPLPRPGPRPLLPRRRGVRQARALRAARGRGHRLCHRLPANAVLQERIGTPAEQAVGVHRRRPQVFFARFSYQAQSWSKPGGWWPRSNGTRASCTRGSASSSPI
jgi:hypothetical protein